MTTARFLTGVFVAAIVTLPVTAFASEIQLASVSAHLFLQGAGTFTDDVTAMRGFGARNFVPFADGYDFGKDKFHSVLIKLLFTAHDEEYEKGQVAQLTVIDSDTGKPVLKRIIRGLYIGPGGRTTVPVLITDHECHGWLIKVTSGSTTIQKELGFTCGE